MELISGHLHNINPPFLDPNSSIEYFYELWVDTTLADPFALMKKRCIPTHTDNTSAIQRAVYYSGVPFPEKDLHSPSFNGSPTFNNLIVSDDGSLFKLIFEVTGFAQDLPPGQVLLEVQEYSIPGLPVLARKFIGYRTIH